MPQKEIHCNDSDPQINQVAHILRETSIEELEAWFLWVMKKKTLKNIVANSRYNNGCSQKTVSRRIKRFQKRFNLDRYPEFTVLFTMIVDR